VTTGAAREKLLSMAASSLLSSQKLVAFVATTDPARAKAFYGGTLGLRLVSEDGFAVVFDANGTTLRVTIAQTFTPAPFTVLGWHVPDIVATVKELEHAGVKFARYGFLEQDEFGIWSAPDGTRVAWFQDPDGNTLSLSQGEG
jgi:catechol 2,3-dioxygenase-like lactoylglutathione lyase family enzyme